MKFIHLKSHLAHTFIRTGQRLNAIGRRIIAPMCPGTISIGGKIVTDLIPLGGYRQPGITKVGRFSFSGLCQGQKVKLYSAFSAKQVVLRVAFQKTSYGNRYFPKIIAHDQTHIMEEWIDGISFKKMDEELQKQKLTEIKHFLSQCGESEELIQLAEGHQGAFCYFQDYLLKRLQRWLALDFVQQSFLSWQDIYAKVKIHIPLRLSHPDLSANNILLENKIGRLVIIDNELLGVGQGWVLDSKNSILNEFSQMEIQQIHPNPKMAVDFLNKSWRLRCIGAALDGGDFKRAYSIAVDPASWNLRWFFKEKDDTQK